jgi:hypothetical protein
MSTRSSMPSMRPGPPSCSSCTARRVSLATPRAIWQESEEGENLDGLSEAQKETFRERAVPVPGGVLRESIELTNDARRDVPSTLIATGFTSDEYKTYATEEPVPSWLAGISELRNATWIDLPTSHWPMWSKPKELAEIIATVARAAAR